LSIRNHERARGVKLEELQPSASVRGILPDAVVSVVSVQWHGSDALTLVYRDPGGKVADEILYRHDEARLQVAERGRPWSFDGDGAMFRLVAEAHRIRLAHLFDPVLAVHTSLVDPLPHQITAVYEAMLPRQPLRFLLADDPGAGKTIMAGLLIKELIARGDLKRCLVICPGSLAEQWQDELSRRFHLPFEILTNDALEAARTGNWFIENDLAIARLDKLSRNEDVQQKLAAPDNRYDLVVCDEAHKLSATFFGGEVKYTKRYRLGQLVSGLTRHFLLMTATPHNGKEEDFQLFLALLDGDRFEGRFRDGVHQVDVTDLMRRMVKESLLKFDGTPLFPERIAYTVPYKLSPAEAHLYREVTNYVREEFNRAEALANDKRAGTVGFALTILQRRLASSPEAIHQSLRRRRERLEKRLRELELLQRGAAMPAPVTAGPTLDADDVEDLEEAPENEVEAAEEQILDQATAASTIAELKLEIETLAHLEALAADVRRSGQDTKWRELSQLLGAIFTPGAIRGVGEPAPPPYGAGPLPKPAPSPRQKLVLFTEHRDTLSYLERQIGALLGRAGAIAIIPRRPGPRGSPQGAGELPARPRGARAARHRRRGRGHQPAARAPDGELRPAVESEPPRAALRPHPPHRPDRGLPPVEPRGRGDARGRRLPAPAGEARRSTASAGRPGLRRARQAAVRGQAPARADDRGHPLRRPAGRARAPHARHRARGRPRAYPGPA
jgi:hypothetical protein